MTLEGFLKYPVAFLVALACAWAATPLIMRFAVAIGMVDQPDARRIHVVPTPRGGGLAVMLGFHAACLLTYFWPWGSFSTAMDFSWWMKFLPLSLLLAGIGLWDDRVGLPPVAKLSGQVLVAVLAYAAGMRFLRLGGVELPWALDLLATVLWIVALINAFNLIDGLDGLAAGLGTIAAMGIAGAFLVADQPGDCLVLLGLMGACLGFLRYNFHPAKVFLGDTGSMFIGFTLAAVSLSTSRKTTVAAALAVPLLAVGVPIFDTALAVWRRSVRYVLNRLQPTTDHAASPRVFGADLDHLHHRLLRTGWSQRRVATVLYLTSLVLVAVGLAAVSMRSLATGIYMIAFVAASYVLVRHVVHVELWDSASALARGLARPPRRWLVVPLYLLVDSSTLFLSYLVARILTAGRFDRMELRYEALQDGILQAGIPFIALIAGRIYQRVWSRARALDFVHLAAAAAAGILLGTGMIMLLNPEQNRQHFANGLVTLAIALPGLVLIRLFKRIVGEGLISLRRGRRETGPVPRALVYGAGDRGVMFVRRHELGLSGDTGETRVLAGFLDDDVNLRGRQVHGLRVLGDSESVEDVLRATGARTIYVAENLAPDIRTRLLTAASRSETRVLEWTSALCPLAPPADTGEVADSG